MSEWQRPSGCSTNECIEVRRGLTEVQIRSGKSNRYALPMVVTLEEWAAFVAAVKAGEYDE